MSFFIKTSQWPLSRSWKLHLYTIIKVNIILSCTLAINSMYLVIIFFELQIVPPPSEVSMEDSKWVQYFVRDKHTAFWVIDDRVWLVSPEDIKCVLPSPLLRPMRRYEAYDFSQGTKGMYTITTLQCGRLSVNDTCY